MKFGILCKALFGIMAKVSIFSLSNFKSKPVIERYKQERSDLNCKNVEFCVEVSAVKSKR